MIEKTAFIKCLNKISADLEKGTALIADDQIAEFDREKNSIVKEIDNILETERTLKIGIVGEVKAGKSSFLNALIFDGEDVLPKAATPMTAALTKLNYSENQKAEIFFYREEDWKGIQKNSDEYNRKIDDEFNKAMKNHEESRQRNIKGILGNKPTRESIENSFCKTLPKKLRECHELVKMAEERDLRPSGFWGKTESISDCPPAEYNKRLNEYIGAKGKYTPLVSHTELYINNKLLENIEIIDTPGLNDGVVSRSQKTRDFLINCDVVFFLSYVVPFLPSEDISFIVNTIPDAGISEAVLVGSQLDNGILDYKKPSAPFKEAFSMSRRSFDEQAAHNIGNCAKGLHAPVIDKLKEALPPFYISSLMYAIARKKEAGKPLHDEEKSTLEQLRSRFSGFSDTVKFLSDLSGIDLIKNDKLQKIRDNKGPIIKDKVSNFIESQVNKFAKILGNIKDNTQSNRNLLKDLDVNNWRDRLEKLNNLLNSIGPKISRVFINYITEMEKTIMGISHSILNDIDKYNNDVEVSTRTEEDSYTTGALWWKKRHITYTKINSANVSEVIINIRKYVAAIYENLGHAYDDLLDRQGLKDSITTIVAEAYDLSDKNFNEDEILLPIEQMLSEFVVAPISIDLESYNGIIFKNFSDATVEDSDINRLTLMQETVLQKIAQDIRDDLEHEKKRMGNSMQQSSETFVSDIKKKINANYEKIAQNLEDKEESLKCYDEFIEEVTECQRKLRAL